jgi:hypothetical protein
VTHGHLKKQHDSGNECRGAHTFFLKQGQVARWGGYTVNLIHYEDAASLCVAVSSSLFVSVTAVFICYTLTVKSGNSTGSLRTELKTVLT